MSYDAFVEARGYGPVEGTVEALSGALEAAELGDDVTWRVLGDEAKNMVLTHFVFADALDAVDAHEVAMTLWTDVWSAAFPEQAPTEVLAVRCVPVAVTA